MLYSLKMRASQSNNHISGAERILNETELNFNIEALINRAIHHSKGKPDFINLKIESIAEDEIQYIDALPVKTVEVPDAATGKQLIVDYLFPTKELISLSLFSASSGVRLLISILFSSSRICSSTGSSSWKNDNCSPSRVCPMPVTGLAAG